MNSLLKDLFNVFVHIKSYVLIFFSAKFERSFFALQKPMSSFDKDGSVFVNNIFENLTFDVVSFEKLDSIIFVQTATVK